MFVFFEVCLITPRISNGLILRLATQENVEINILDIRLTRRLAIVLDTFIDIFIVEEWSIVEISFIYAYIYSYLASQ